jgi:hypothetical protein
MDRAPDFAEAYAQAAWCYFLRQALGWPTWKPDEGALVFVLQLKQSI